MTSLISALNRFSSNIFNPATAIIFPAKCRICGSLLDSFQDPIACSRCWDNADALFLKFDHCEKCDGSLPFLQNFRGQRYCGKCDQLAFARARSIGSYQGAIRESILSLKVTPYLSPPLIDRLSSAFYRLPDNSAVDAIIPVPLHPNRQTSRGFNQAEMMASAISERIGLPVISTSLIRRKDTERHRAGMDATERMHSMENVFRVRAKKNIEGKNILVVDDVMTTGATAGEIAGTLLAEGATSVSFLTIARAIHLFA